MLERVIEKAFVRIGARHRVWCLKLYLAGQAGFPDRLCLAPGGRVAFAEIKAPGEKPRRLQEHVHERLRALGFRVAVIDRVEDCDPFFVEWLY